MNAIEDLSKPCPARRDSAKRKDGRKWTATRPINGSRMLVECEEDGTKGFVAVSFDLGVSPKLFGCVYSLADFDEHGNHWAEETIDGSPVF